MKKLGANSAQVRRNKTVMEAAAFFERRDAGGHSIRVITSSGVRQTRLRGRRAKSIFS